LFEQSTQALAEVKGDVDKAVELLVPKGVNGSAAAKKHAVPVAAAAPTAIAAPVQKAATAPIGSKYNKRKYRKYF